MAQTFNAIPDKPGFGNGYTLADEVYVNVNANTSKIFEEKYIEIRAKENRIYSDMELRNLPFVENTHLHRKEWQMRSQSANRLFQYLQQKNMSLKILEVGCGNGWLSNFLSKNDKNYVVGIDINFTELKQAARVFKKGNLVFVFDELSEELLAEFNFDVVIFAASAQYFYSIKQTIEKILPLINKDGEVHLLDTNFYKPENLEAARRGTEEYYSKLGFPEFSKYYHHHSIYDLTALKKDQLYDPTAIKNIFIRPKNPFPWFRIKR